MFALVAVDLEDDDEQELLDDMLPLLDRLQATVRLVFVDMARPSTIVEGANPELLALLAAAGLRRDEDQRRRLDALLRRVAPDRRAGILVLDARKAADAIVEQAPGHDLIVVRSLGRQGIERLWLGSVAERVVRSSPIPVLVVRGPASAVATSESRILAAVDLDSGADVLAAEALRWALAFRAKVDALFVSPEIVLAPIEPAVALAMAMETTEAERSARSRLDGWLQRMPSDLRGNARVERGTPATAIVTAGLGSLLVLVGTHGRRGAVRFWLGSVAERVARRAPVPVLVVPIVETEPLDAEGARRRRA